MAKYRIAWLPGDGVGIDVMEATCLVLDTLGLDADYIPGDIGWEHWRTEGDALPARTVEEFDIDGPLVDSRAKGHRVELVGRARVGGRVAWELRVTRKTGSVERHFLDAASGLPVRVETKAVVRGVPVEGETEIGDYREEGGLQWPFSIRSGPRGRPEKQSLAVERIEINPELDDARFRMPAPRE